MQVFYLLDIITTRTSAQYQDRPLVGSHVFAGGMWWRSWLRHCAISRKVAGSIPDDVIDIILPAVLRPWD
jgi:hypothetical protein